MFERFTDSARNVVVQAQEDARRLGHNYIGCEHLLLAAAAAAEPASAVLRDQGVTPGRVEAEILRTIGRGHTADPLGGLDRQALAFIGIDLDVVRARIEAAFGPDALTPVLPAACQSRRPAWGKGPLAELARRRRRRRARRNAALAAGARGNALHDNYIGVQHLALALLLQKDGMVPVILSALGASATPLHAAILARYRKAS